ncbi:MAG: hypothetical protein ACREHE_11080 [Rhizomicrobium sp.]
MDEAHVRVTHAPAAAWRRWLAMPLSAPSAEALAIALLCPVLLGPGLVNGAPFVFYDTGAYLVQGLGHVFMPERSAVYSLFLAAAGARYSLWLAAIVQCLVTAFLMTELARALRPRMPVWALAATGVVLAAITGLPWYVAQIEPDCFAAATVIGLYLLLFGGAELDAWRRLAVVVCTALSVAAHPSHLAVAAGLVLVVALTRLPPVRRILGAGFPRARLAAASIGVAAAIATIFACNYALSGGIFFSRSGAVFLMARMMEDGLIKPVLDETCPVSGYRLCPYRNNLPARADTFLWKTRQSPFEKLGGFNGLEAESAALVGQSLARRPLENLGYALGNGLLQFVWFQTGDGIVKQIWVSKRAFHRAIPQPADRNGDDADWRESTLRFLPLNLIHIPVGFLSLAGLVILLRHARRARSWAGGLLPAFILLALLGNAFVCGVFSAPHGRYQSRVIWLSTFALVLAAWPRIEARIGEAANRRAARG